MNPPHQEIKHARRLAVEFTKASKRKHRQQTTTTKATESSSALRTNSPTPDEISIWPITNIPAEIWQLAAICITACISLLLMEFVANETVFAQFFPPHPGPADSYWVLRFKVWWVAWALIAYIALPTIITLLLPGKRLRDCNLSWQGFRQHYSVYVVLYAAVLPVIWLVSLSPDFYNFYPMYGQAGRSWFDLLAWEGFIRRPIRRARIFLPRIFGGRTFALHRNLRCPGFRDALHDDPFHKAVARSSRVHRGRIGSRQSCVEDQINLGRRLRPLRGRHHHGSSGALAQRPTALAAQLAGRTLDQRSTCS